MRGCLTYLWRKILLDFWNWWLGLAIAAFGLWALFALPLIKVYPVCYDPADIPHWVELRGEATLEFDRQFIDVWRQTGGVGPISAGRRVPIIRYYMRDKQSVSYLTGIAMRDMVQYRFFPRADIDISVLGPPRFPHLWVNWYAPHCDALRKIALAGGAWVNRGPDLWPDGDPDPDAPPIPRLKRR